MDYRDKAPRTVPAVRVNANAHSIAFAQIRPRPGCVNIPDANRKEVMHLVVKVRVQWGRDRFELLIRL